MVRVEFLRKMRFHSYVDAGMFFTVAQFYTQKINLNWYSPKAKPKGEKKNHHDLLVLP